MDPPLSKLFSRVQMEWVLASDKEEDLGVNVVENYILVLVWCLSIVDYIH